MAAAFGNLITLPAEIRAQIWHCLLNSHQSICASARVGPKPSASILRTCHQAYTECTPVLYAANTFTILISQSLSRPLGLDIPRKYRKWIRRLRIQVMLDHKGPTAAFLGNIAESVQWVRTIGASLLEVLAKVYEEEEDDADESWMPGLQRQAVRSLLALRAPVVRVGVPLALVGKLEGEGGTVEERLERYMSEVRLEEAKRGVLGRWRGRMEVIERAEAGSEWEDGGGWLFEGGGLR